MRSELSIARLAKMKLWHPTSAGKIRNSYHSWRRSQSRNEYTIRSSRDSTDPCYRAHSDHYSHPLASLADTCRAGVLCGVALVFPKSAQKTRCVLVSRFVSWGRRGGPITDSAQSTPGLPRTGGSLVRGVTPLDAPRHRRQRHIEGEQDSPAEIRCSI